LVNYAKEIPQDIKISEFRKPNSSLKKFTSKLSTLEEEEPYTFGGFYSIRPPDSISSTIDERVASVLNIYSVYSNKSIPPPGRYKYYLIVGDKGNKILSNPITFPVRVENRSPFSTTFGWGISHKKEDSNPLLQGTFLEQIIFAEANVNLFAFGNTPSLSKIFGSSAQLDFGLEGNYRSLDVLESTLYFRIKFANLLQIPQFFNNKAPMPKFDPKLNLRLFFAFGNTSIFTSEDVSEDILFLQSFGFELSFPFSPLNSSTNFILRMGYNPTEARKGLTFSIGLSPFITKKG